MRRTGLFGLVSAGVIVTAGALLLLVFPGRPSTVAIALSAAVALLVQLVAFTILRRTRDSGVLVGWGLGSILRLGTLAVYALVVIQLLGLPATPALVSLATFLFATMILEP
ncbi:MAG TPA: hypothetical protein VFZ56_11775, partial [Gemmatimonadaceae bacterium]